MNSIHAHEHAYTSLYSFRGWLSSALPHTLGHTTHQIFVIFLTFACFVYRPFTRAHACCYCVILNTKKMIFFQPYHLGKELIGNNVNGVLAFRRPWPGMARSVYGDHARYLATYTTQYPGFYFTGDGVIRDEHGVINCSYTHAPHPYAHAPHPYAHAHNHTKHTQSHIHYAQTCTHAQIHSRTHAHHNHQASSTISYFIIFFFPLIKVLLDHGRARSQSHQAHTITHTLRTNTHSCSNTLAHACIKPHPPFLTFLLLFFFPNQSITSSTISYFIIIFPLIKVLLDHRSRG